MNIFCGDTHGDFSPVWEGLLRLDVQDANLIHVGDIGVGFPTLKRNFIEKWDHIFRRRNITFYGVRGNHDDPAYFDGSVNLENFKLQTDCSVLNIGGERIFFAGGAISLDRKMRQEGVSYWSGEAFNAYDWEKVIGKHEIDTVVTHACPSSVIPVEKPSHHNSFFKQIGLHESDPEIIDDLTTELKHLDDLEKYLIKNCGIKRWFYGHYHVSSIIKCCDIEYRCLNINELCGSFSTIPLDQFRH